MIKFIKKALCAGFLMAALCQQEGHAMDKDVAGRLVNILKGFFGANKDIKDQASLQYDEITTSQYYTENMNRDLKNWVLKKTNHSLAATFKTVTIYSLFQKVFKRHYTEFEAYADSSIFQMFLQSTVAYKAKNLASSIGNLSIMFNEIVQKNLWNGVPIAPGKDGAAEYYKLNMNFLKQMDKIAFLINQDHRNLVELNKTISEKLANLLNQSNSSPYQDRGLQAIIKLFSPRYTTFQSKEYPDYEAIQTTLNLTDTVDAFQILQILYGKQINTASIDKQREILETQREIGNLRAYFVEYLSSNICQSRFLNKETKLSIAADLKEFKPQENKPQAQNSQKTKSAETPEYINKISRAIKKQTN